MRNVCIYRKVYVDIKVYNGYYADQSGNFVGKCELCLSAGIEPDYAYLRNSTSALIDKKLRGTKIIAEFFKCIKELLLTCRINF